MIKLNKKYYDLLKWVCRCVLPLTASVIFVISSLVFVENSGTIIGIIITIDAGLGIILESITKKYEPTAGTIVIVPGDDAFAAAGIHIDLDYQDIIDSDYILLNVVKAKED